MIGFCVNCLDKYADKRDNSEGELNVADDEKFAFSDLKKLNCQYFLVITNCLLTYICVFPFLAVATSYFQTRFHLTEKHSGTVVVSYASHYSPRPTSSQAYSPPS